MEPLLNLFRQLNEIDLRYSRFGFQNKPVSFNPTDRSILVFFAVNGSEVLSQRK
jgi:hypothetical protein